MALDPLQKVPVLAFLDLKVWGIDNDARPVRAAVVVREAVAFEIEADPLFAFRAGNHTSETLAVELVAEFEDGHGALLSWAGGVHRVGVGRVGAAGAQRGGEGFATSV